MKAWLILRETFRKDNTIEIERVVSIIQSRLSESKIKEYLLQMYMDMMGVNIEKRFDFANHRYRYRWEIECTSWGFKLGHDPWLAARRVSNLRVESHERNLLWLTWNDRSNRNRAPVYDS